MEPRLIVYILSVALLLTGSVATLAAQSDRFVGFHELPPFVCERVELVPADRSAIGAGPGGSERGTPGDVRVPGHRSAICSRAAPGWQPLT